MVSVSGVEVGVEVICHSTFRSRYLFKNIFTLKIFLNYVPKSTFFGLIFLDNLSFTKCRGLVAQGTTYRLSHNLSDILAPDSGLVLTKPLKHMSLIL